MKAKIRNFLYQVGRKLMHLNYTGNDAVEHDLRLEIQQKNKQIDDLKLELSIAKARLAVWIRMQ